MSRAAHHLLGIALLVAGACVFAWRGEAELVGDHDLAGVVAVRIDLPSTPMSIETCEPAAPGACPERLRYAGRVLATGGSEGDAKAHAQKPALVFERDDGLGRLMVDVPLAVRGLVDFELAAVELPADRDLELHTDRGDIDVFGLRGALTIDVGRGDVEVDGGDAGVAIAVEVGDIDVRTGGDADLQTESGRVTLVQDAGPRRVFVDADGDVEIELAGSADLELDLEANDGISIRTASVVALADRTLRRRVGAATILVEVRAGGAISITERP